MIFPLHTLKTSSGASWPALLALTSACVGNLSGTATLPCGFLPADRTRMRRFHAMMTMRRQRIATLAAMTLALALPAMATAVTSRADNLAHPRAGRRWRHDARRRRGWRRRCRCPRRRPATSRGATNQTAMAQALADEFGGKKVATGAQGIALWGSDRMGTWTMVLERADATSCVIASGSAIATAPAHRSFSASGLNG